MRLFHKRGNYCQSPRMKTMDNGPIKVARNNLGICQNGKFYSCLTSL